MSQTTVSVEVLKKLPKPGSFVRHQKVYDTDGKEREVIVWQFQQFNITRRASFDLQTGEYIGENW